MNGNLETRSEAASAGNTLTLRAPTPGVYDVVGQAVAWGDWDGDGDLAVANEAQANQIWENDGAGDLVLDPISGWGWASGETDRSLDLAWGDRDGDGDLDLATTDGWGNLYLYTNDGGGELTLSVTMTTQFLQPLRPRLGNPGYLDRAQRIGRDVAGLGRLG